MTTNANQTPEFIPTVTDVPKRPVVLPDQPGAVQTPPAAAQSTEDARMERALAAFGIGTRVPDADGGEPKPTVDPRAARGAEATQTPPTETTQTPPVPPVAPPAPPVPPVAAAPDVAGQLDRLTLLERQLSAREAAFTEKEKGLQKYVDFDAHIREKDVIGALASLGYSFDDISRAAIEKRGVETAQDRVSKDVSALRDEIRQLREAREQEQRASLEAQTFREIDQAIAAKSPLLAQYGALGRDAVFAHIRDEFARSGGRVVLSYEQAVSAVESEFAGLVKKALAVETIRQQFLGTPTPNTIPIPPSGTSDSATPVTPGRTQTTISNTDASTVARRSDSDVLSEEERLARAFRHLE